MTFRFSLPIGTRLISKNGEEDHGAMSWDENNHEVHRRTGPDAAGVIVSKDFTVEDGWLYDVIFPASEVWVKIYGYELATSAYELTELGKDRAPEFETPNPYRDPYVVAQIENQKREHHG